MFYFNTDKLIILIFTLLISSCAMYDETYNNPDRRCWVDEKYSFGEIKCEAFIDLNCESLHTTKSYHASGNRKKVYVRLVNGPTSPQVGELFDQKIPFPIFVKNGSPWEILKKDVSRILVDAGYTVLNRPEGVRNFVEADFKLLDVRSTAGGGLTDFKGKIQAKSKFTVKLIDQSENEIWSEEFEGRSESNFTYSYLNDYKKALGNSYCISLQKFSQAANETLFANKVK